MKETAFLYFAGGKLSVIMSYLNVGLDLIGEIISNVSYFLREGLTNLFGELMSTVVDSVPNCGNVELFPPVLDHSFFVK